MNTASYLAAKTALYGSRLMEVTLAEHGLLLGHHAVMCALDDFGPLSQQELADSLDFDKSHLVSRIDHLEERGLVSRTRDRADRRRHQVALTAAGKALIDQLRPVAREHQRRLLDALSATEQQTLLDMLRRVLAANDAARDGADA
jgi:DNA-binding MarR family transcriptional regulator